MMRGTTPTLEFVLPFDTAGLAEVYVTIAQGGKTKAEKTLEDCTAQKCLLSTKLTQEETLSLEADRMVEIQLRVKTAAGDALASNVIRENAERILKDGVI